MNEKQLGRRIRAARRAQDLRQHELAALCGVGTRFVSELENGKRSVELGRMLRVVEALGLKLVMSERSWRDVEHADES